MKGQILNSASDYILETPRLGLRQMNEGDWDALCAILQDDETMHAYEGAFDDAAVRSWLDNQIRRYAEEDGHGLWAVVLKDTGEMIGQCGLTYQDCDGRRVLEVGYLFNRAFWHRGFAAEAAQACRDYAFGVCGAHEVFSIIRDTNLASMAVALRNGMHARNVIVKLYRGVEMPHVVFSIRREDLPTE